MLAAAQRLRRSSDFAAAVRGGRRAGRGSVVVHLTVPPQPELSEPARSEESSVRAGFVVSKAVGGAVTRNTVRRRLRHLVRDRLAGLPAGSVLVVRAQPGAATAPYERLGADLDAALAAARSPFRGRGGGNGQKGRARG
ncbi:ribonuclease P protein component [Phytohabitans sp. ZYX-F-186]|uniref:Ribonuclease P protein component n=1 Tax=Phytohabitans maris TaxID=3071409 RepID=A0ABU0ZKG8_9ACTN|nr:ribonuclease P protein component [Phytohabitans sp. ZYX-F-186]MDQ7907026.1 ribonuclease P protein component [Phytohabitans sp. ZYX-F-186]